MSSYEALAPWYDKLTGDIPYEEFADWYESIFASQGAEIHTILDLACGTGTLDRVLAERGYEMIGVDASCDMLAEAMDKAFELDEQFIRPMFLCQNLTELDLYGTVDAAICSLDGFNYLSGEDIPEVLRRLRLFIRPGGLLIFDVNSPDRLRSLDGMINLDETEDLLCLWRGEIDESEQALIYGIDIFTRRGELWQRKTEEHIEYLHEPDFLLAKLREQGFINTQFSREGPQSDKGRVFFVAVNGRDMNEK